MRKSQRSDPSGYGRHTRVKWESDGREFFGRMVFDGELDGGVTSAVLVPVVVVPGRSRHSVPS